MHVAYLGDKVSQILLQRTAFSVQLQPDGSVQEVRCALPESEIEDAWIEKDSETGEDVLVVVGKFPQSYDIFDVLAFSQHLVAELTLTSMLILVFHLSDNLTNLTHDPRQFCRFLEMMRSCERVSLGEQTFSK